MSTRRRGRGNRRARLEKAIAERKALEDELEKLSKAANQEERAKEIRDYILQQGDDPMIAEDNPFKQGNNNGCCIIL